MLPFAFAERRCGPMSAIPWKKVTPLLTAASFVVLSAGCGSKPPCDTDISAVDAARSDAESADRALEDARAQKDRLEKQVAAEKARTSELEREKAELTAKIEELGG
jgi:hypothetical protein